MTPLCCIGYDLSRRIVVVAVRYRDSFERIITLALAQLKEEVIAIGRRVASSPPVASFVRERSYLLDAPLVSSFWQFLSLVVRL